MTKNHNHTTQQVLTMFTSVYVHIGAQVWVVDELQCLSLAVDPDGVWREWQAVTTTRLTGMGGGEEGGGAEVSQAKLRAGWIHAGVG